MAYHTISRLLLFCSCCGVPWSVKPHGHSGVILLIPRTHDLIGTVGGNLQTSTIFPAGEGRCIPYRPPIPPPLTNVVFYVTLALVDG